MLCFYSRVILEWLLIYRWREKGMGCSTLTTWILSTYLKPFQWGNSLTHDKELLDCFFFQRHSISDQNPRYLNASKDSTHCQLYGSPVRHIISCPSVTCLHTLTFQGGFLKSCSQPCPSRHCSSMRTRPLPSSQPSPFPRINLKVSTVSVLISCACCTPLMLCWHFWESTKWNYCLPLEAHKPRAAGSPVEERRLHRALWEPLWRVSHWFLSVMDLSHKWSETTARKFLQRRMKYLPNREPPEGAMIISINA